jgi:hypothetical protein
VDVPPCLPVTALSVIGALGVSCGAWLTHRELHKRKAARKVALLAARYRRLSPWLTERGPVPSQPITVPDLVARLRAESRSTRPESLAHSDGHVSTSIRDGSVNNDASR